MRFLVSFLCVFFVSFFVLTAMPDVKIGPMESQVPGFVSVTVEDVYNPAWDKNKVEKDFLTNYLLNVDHIVAIYPSELSTKKIDRTSIVMSWISEVLTVPTNMEYLSADMRKSFEVGGGVIGNSPFPRFGDELKKREEEKHKPKDKGHPDKAKDHK